MVKIENVNNQRILTPESGMWLYNATVQVISDKVYLGIEADENEWTEITKERKEELEALWYEDATSGDIATDTDYQNALAEFGVKL